MRINYDSENEKIEIPECLEKRIEKEITEDLSYSLFGLASSGN